MEERKAQEQEGKLPKPICDIAAGLVTFIDQMDQRRKTNNPETKAKDILYYDDNIDRRKKKIQR